MRQALALAERGLGRVWPNPAVGCVLIKDGLVVGRGWTQDGGRPHAETEALRRAGAAAEGATAYVSLEPCSHYGQTPPCIDALLAAGIKRVVLAVEDPDLRVAGQGIEALELAGVAVETGVLEEAAREVNAGFFSRIQKARPLISLKIASSLDARTATEDGDSQWITGPAARSHGHLLRAQYDAILVGAGTVLADDPELTCRLPGLEGASPVRVIADTNLNMLTTAKLVAGAGQVPTWILIGEDCPADRREPFAAAGVDLLPVATGADCRIDLQDAMSVLAGRGITRLLVEGGATLAAALLRADLVDRIHWFRAPVLLGGDALAGVAGLDIAKLSDARRLVRTKVQVIGDDLLETYAVRA